MALPINIDELLHGHMVEWDRVELKKERIVTREYRNRKLGGFLKELKLTEGRGTGFPIIYNSLEINGSPPPIFETDDNRSYFLSTIKIHALAEQIKILEAKDDYKDIEWIVYSVGDINNYLSLLVSKKRDIDKSLAMGWILYTLPDKPNSKKQKYIISESGKTILKNEYSLIKRTPVHSSNIASVGYDDNNQILEIEFHHGAIFRYFDVPKEVFEGLMNAGSQASFFYHNIRENYEYQKT